MSKNKKKKFKFFSDLLLEQRIMWVVVLLLLCIFCFFAYVQYKAVIHKNGYPVKNLTNDSIKEEHCYDDVCFKNVVIYYDKEDISSVYGKMYYKGTGVKDACAKLKFLREGTTDTYDFNICYFGLKAYKEIDFETYFEEDQADLIFSKDYELAGLSSEEYDELYQAYIKESE